MDYCVDDKTIEFIEKAKNIHGDKYDYSLVKFIKMTGYIIITCKKHGEFKQKAFAHLRGQGCLLCAIEKSKKSVDEYIKKANDIHGDKYDYSKVVYVNGSTPVIIICPIHGEFKQALGSHINNKQGCPLCGHIVSGIKSRIKYSEFVKRAQKLHGSKYDYETYKDSYIKYDKPMKIVCPEHGVFMQRPLSHCLGGICPKCLLKNNRINKWPDILNKLNQIHGDKYEYYFDTYIRNGLPMKIRCKKHNIVFYQTLNNHIIPQEGCPVCLKSKILNNQEDVLIRMQKKHNYKYTYPDFKYNGVENKIKIECPIHGIFYQLVHSHLKGSGCQKCGIEKRVSGMRITMGEFIERARKIHGDKYEYIKIFQNKGVSWIEAKCPIHGLFIQTINGHAVAGYGCEKCGHLTSMLTTEEFIQKSKEKFGDIFSYDKTIYKGSKEKVIITCKKHGDFEQNASEHIRYNRSLNPCPKCNATNGEITIMKFLQRNKFEYIKEFKLPGYNYRYDFCIPKYKILIEYDGPQHFEFIPFFFKTKEDFEKRMEIDKIKNDLANESGYKIIRIKYTINNIDRYLNFRISALYRYCKNGKLYKNFIEFARRNNLLASSRPSDYAQYKTHFN